MADPENILPDSIVDHPDNPIVDIERQSINPEGLVKQILNNALTISNTPPYATVIGEVVHVTEGIKKPAEFDFYSDSAIYQKYFGTGQKNTFSCLICKLRNYDSMHVRPPLNNAQDVGTVVEQMLLQKVYTMENTSWFSFFGGDPKIKVGDQVRVDFFNRAQRKGAYVVEIFTKSNDPGTSTGPSTPSNPQREMDAGGQPVGETDALGWPLAEVFVTDPYDPTDSNWRGRPHNGVDLRAAIGTEVLAPGAGIVTRTTSGPGIGVLLEFKTSAIGNVPEIWHKFMHLRSLAELPRPGASFQKGDRIAWSGNTGGRNTGAHLHWEVRLGGSGAAPTDPESLFSAKAPGKGR